MQNIEQIPMETLKLANDVLARPATAETAEARTLAQALVNVNESLTVVKSQREMAQKD